MSIFWSCILIFFCRIVDVSLGTIRTVFNVKGKILVGALIGFVEAVVWFTIISQAISDATNIWIILSYGGGFALGSYVGGLLSGLFTRGKVQMQLIIDAKNKGIISSLRENGYAVTAVDVAKSEFSSEKIMLFVEVESKETKKIRELVGTFDKNAFIMVNESKEVYGGHFIRK